MCELHFKGKKDDYNSFLEEIESRIDFSKLGKEYQINESLSTTLHFLSIPRKEYDFRVIKLYKYEPQTGYAPIQENSRKFCKQLYIQTMKEHNYLTYAELMMLVNPGSKYGIKDILFYVGNYSTSFTTCRHKWTRFLFDTQTGALIKDVTQPNYAVSVAKK